MSKKRHIVAPEASVGYREHHEQIEDHLPPPQDETSPAHERALKRVDLAKVFVTVSDQIAESKIFYRNWKWPKCYEVFPNSLHAAKRFVTKYYPNAVGGPLYVDEPRTPKEKQDALEKQKILRKQGIRHIIVDGETDYFKALEQLDPMRFEAA